MNSELQLIIGPMFSGKTSELIRRINRYVLIDKKCIVIKSNKDNRDLDNQNIYTHDKVNIPAYNVDNLNNISQIIIDNYDVFGIDEGQFFVDIKTFVKLLLNNNKIIIISALDATYSMEPFYNICNLIPLAEKVKKLSAICIDCGNNAYFSKRIINNSNIELIGGKEVYKPVCRPCFHKKN